MLENSVLKSVFVHVNESIAVGKSCLNENITGLARRSDGSRVEVLLNNFTSINISENTDLLSVLVSLELDEFLTEDDLDSSLVALVKSNLVSVRELEDLLIGSPVLNSRSS
jgi:hypothetical protein